jgi:hypothetical protein
LKKEINMTVIDTLRSATLTLLQDTSNYVFSQAEVDTALRQALLDYSNDCPRPAQITLNAAGGSLLDLSAASGLLSLQKIHWRWDAAIDALEQESNRVQGWRFFLDSGSAQAQLLLSDGTPSYPQAGDAVRVEYEAAHTIAGLADENGISPSVSSVPSAHLELLVRGAAGYAFLSGAADRSDLLDRALSERLGNAFLLRFHNQLERLGRGRNAMVTALWRGMDKYETHP